MCIFKIIIYLFTSYLSNCMYIVGLIIHLKKNRNFNILFSLLFKKVSQFHALMS